MNRWTILRRARITLLFLLALVYLAYATFFAIFLSHEWSYSSLFQKIVIAGLPSLYVFTAILLYLMAVIPLCPWRDIVGMFAILVVHIGTSVLFTHYRPSFESPLPCLGYDTDADCKKFVFMIFVGCWVLSGTTLCVTIAIGVMAFIPQPVEPEAVLESLQVAGTEMDVLPSTPDRLKARSPTDERRTSLTLIRTELPVVTYNSENNGGGQRGVSLPPDRSTSPLEVNSSHREAITLEPPHVWLGFRGRNPRYSNGNRMRGGTMSTRDAPPEGSTGIGSVPLRHGADPFSQKFSSHSPTSRVPISSQASMIRRAVGGKNTPAAKVRPNQTSTFPKLLHDTSSSIPLRNSPSLVTMRRDRTPEYMPTVFNNNSVVTPPWDDSPPTYRDHAQTTPNVYSHPAPANVRPIEEEPTPYVLLPSVPYPVVARSKDPSAFWGPKDISSENNAPFATGGPNAPLMRSVSRPRRIVRHSGAGTVHHVEMPPINEAPFVRRGNDEQVTGQTQWWGLVRSAATGP